MIARLLISPSIKKIKEEIQQTLASYSTSGNMNHPDVLYMQAGEKLGIAEAKKIKEHFSLKPYSAKGRVVVLEDAGVLTQEAQNALLKTLEEPPQEAILILGASSDANLLPTVLSRCEIIHLDATPDDTLVYHSKYGQYAEDLDKLLNAIMEERFEYIEKLKDKAEFLRFLVHAFRDMLHPPKPSLARPGLARTEVTNFLKELMQAEKWVKQNVNIRATLEYLMLVMPKIESRI